MHIDQDDEDEFHDLPMDENEDEFVDAKPNIEEEKYKDYNWEMECPLDRNIKKLYDNAID